MDACSEVDKVKGRRKTNFRVSPSQPNDIRYKMDLFLTDVSNFYDLFAVPPQENQNCLNLQFQRLSKSSDLSTTSGYSSTTSSSISDVSNTGGSNSMTSQLLQRSPEITEQQLKTINIYFSSLSTSVFTCMTATRVYQLDNIYELGLREASHKILGWNQLGEGILFVQFEKLKTEVNTYLCLANATNCHLYSKILLSRDSKFNQIRSCLQYFVATNENECTKVYGLFFANEQLSSEFCDKVHRIFECWSEDNVTYQRRASTSNKDSEKITWLQKIKAVNQSGQSLTEYIFSPRCKTPQPTRPQISVPSDFEQTLHVSLDEYL